MQEAIIMSETSNENAGGGALDSALAEAQRLLLEMRTLRAQAEEHFVAAETSRKKADSEGLFAFNAKEACEKHATTVSQIKGVVESEATTIQSNRQKCDELMAALIAGKATIDADEKTISERRKTAERDAASVEASSELCATRVQELEKAKATADEALNLTRESRDAVLQDQKQAATVKASIEALSVDAEKKVQLIEDNCSVSNKGSVNIQNLVTAAKASETELATVLEHLKKSDETASGYEALVLKITEDLEVLRKRVVALLPGATSAGLASSFNAQKERFALPQKRWLRTFIWCIGGLVLVALPSFLAALGVPILGHSADSTSSEVWRGLLMRMPIVIPLVWLAIYAGRNYMLSLRMEEEYAYKEAVSTAFEGYKREMTSIEAGDPANPSPLTRLSANVLAAIAERPGRIYEGKHSDITILTEAQIAAIEMSELAKKKIANG
jgi:hypothetical protein